MRLSDALLGFAVHDFKLNKNGFQFLVNAHFRFADVDVNILVHRVSSVAPFPFQYPLRLIIEARGCQAVGMCSWRAAIGSKNPPRY
jgi:hypothetical protein